MPLHVVVVLVLASATLGARLGPGVSAAFTSSSTKSTGTLSFASLTASFATGTDDLGAAGGVGGSSYTMTVTGLTLGLSTHRFTTLTNTGSVTETITGTVSAAVSAGSFTVAVDACSQAWSLGVCGGTTTALLAATTMPAAVSYGSLAVSGVRYLRYTFTSTSALSTATVTASAVPQGTGTGNRTAG
ncbi:MAG: hypothetical protein WCD35_13225 [Mycobacteriales bacterium]